MQKNSKKKSINKARTISFTVVVLLLMTGFFPLIPMVDSEETNEDTNITINVIASSDNEEILISYTIIGFNKEVISYEDQEYYRYYLNDESNLLRYGFPDLPAVQRSIIIPDDKKMSVDVIDVSYVEYDDIEIIPSKGEISRIFNPDDIPYVFNDIYNEDLWYPEQNVELYDPYIIRDFRGLVVQMNPIQYNPLQHKIRVVSEITIKVTSIGPGEINVIDRLKPLEVVNTEFEKIYDNHFLNYNMYLSNAKYTPVADQGTMLVICYDDFYDEMLPFVAWKNMKGQFTEIVNVSDVGTTATAIDTYIEDYFNANGLTFVLLVGDVAQVPTLSASGGESDVSFSYISSDHYADLFIGRFSAENIDQVETQVERTVEYEKYPLDGGNWYHRGLGVASNQGPGDDGEYDDEHIDVIRDKLLAYTYTEVEQSYDPTGSSTIIANAVNNGLSIVNYCGHGSTTSWGNGGGFSNYNVNALVNDNMLPFIVSVACVVGNFGGQTCFTEAWLRATNNGEPTGAVAHFGSSINQDWYEPMDGQDEINDILVESYVNNIKRTFGGLAFNGVMHMLDEYPSAGIDEADTWHIFGDPSIEVRTDTPTAISVAHSPSISGTAETFEVTVDGIEDALCALSYNGFLLGSGYTDSNGDGIITLDHMIPNDAESLDVVVTAYNTIPYIATVNVIGQQPLLAYNTTIINAGVLAQDEVIQTTFEIWNDNEGVLNYTLSESCSWIEVSPLLGSSSGEHDTITVTVDTTGLSYGQHDDDISIFSNGGNAVVEVSVYIINENEILDIEQSVANRGFPIRHTWDGDWGAAQNFTANVDTLSRAEIYVRKFGNPEFDLTVEFRTDNPEGILLDTLSFSPEEILSSWQWLILDIDDITDAYDTNFFIVCPNPPGGVTTSFGYEWGYAFGDQYQPGSFWFTRDGGGLWRDLPDVYEFTFKTYGII
jgi:peptidase C25-like protein